MGERTRIEREHDTLAALVMFWPFRTRVPWLRRDDFTTSDHRALCDALQRNSVPVDLDGQRDFVARALSWSIEQAARWLNSSSPIDYDFDARWLGEHRDGC